MADYAVGLLTVDTTPPVDATTTQYNVSQCSAIVTAGTYSFEINIPSFSIARTSQQPSWIFVGVNPRDGSLYSQLGFTQPIVSDTPPLLPPGEYWFDTISNVFKRNSGFAYEVAYGVFIAKVVGNTVSVPFPHMLSYLDSQNGLLVPTTPVDVYFDGQVRPIAGGGGGGGGGGLTNIPFGRPWSMSNGTSFGNLDFEEGIGNQIQYDDTLNTISAVSSVRFNNDTLNAAFGRSTPFSIPSADSYNLLVGPGASNGPLSLVLYVVHKASVTTLDAINHVLTLQTNADMQIGTYMVVRSVFVNNYEIEVVVDGNSNTLSATDTYTPLTMVFQFDSVTLPEFGSEVFSLNDEQYVISVLLTALDGGESIGLVGFMDTNIQSLVLNDAVLPLGAIQGETFEVTSAGVYGGVFTNVGDFVTVFGSSLSRIAVQRLPPDIPPNIATNASVALAIDSASEPVEFGVPTGTITAAIVREIRKGLLSNEQPVDLNDVTGEIYRAIFTTPPLLSIGEVIATPPTIHFVLEQDDIHLSTFTSSISSPQGFYLSLARETLPPVAWGLLRVYDSPVTTNLGGLLTDDITIQPIVEPDYSNGFDHVSTYTVIRISRQSIVEAPPTYQVDVQYTNLNAYDLTFPLDVGFIKTSIRGVPSPVAVRYHAFNSLYAPQSWLNYITASRTHLPPLTNVIQAGTSAWIKSLSPFSAAERFSPCFVDTSNASVLFGAGFRQGISNSGRPATTPYPAYIKPTYLTNVVTVSSHDTAMSPTPAFFVQVGAQNGVTLSTNVFGTIETVTLNIPPLVTVKLTVDFLYGDAERMFSPEVIVYIETMSLPFTFELP